VKSISLIVRAVYEKSVLKLLEDVDLREGEEVIVVAGRKPNMDRFVGKPGKAPAKELEAYEEEVYSS